MSLACCTPGSGRLGPRRLQSCLPVRSTSIACLGGRASPRAVPSWLAAGNGHPWTGEAALGRLPGRTHATPAKGAPLPELEEVDTDDGLQVDTIPRQRDQGKQALYAVTQGLMQDTPLLVTRIIDYAAKFHGAQEVVVRELDGCTTVSNYGKIHGRAQACALALKRLGVRPGDRVATLAWNTVRHLEAWYGIPGCGAVCHTLNPRLFEKDLEYIINCAEDSVILADVCFVGLLERLAPRLGSVRHIVLLTDKKGMPEQPFSLGSLLCYEELLAAEVPALPGFQWEACSEGQACAMCFTSGTTGKPKGVLYSHRSCFLHSFVAIMPDCFNLGSSSTVLAVVPMFHANCWGLAFAAPMVGAKLVLPGPFLDGASIHRLLDEHRVTHSAGVPTVWLGLAQHLEQCGAQLSHLKLMLLAGTTCPRNLIEYYQEGQGVEVRQPWGMTELSPCGTVAAVKGTLAHLDQEGVTQLKLKQGRGHVLCDLRIVDDEGQELPWDGTAFGHLQARGPHTLSRYYNSDAPAADEEGWFDTGDIATIDAEGYIQLTDRAKDVIKSGGEWISSMQIEAIAMEHPQVMEAAVIGIPDPKWSERPLLIIVPREGQEPSRRSVLAHLEGRIARWWMPDAVEFMAGGIPHTATGKPSKVELRRMFADHVPAGRGSGA